MPGLKKMFGKLFMKVYTIVLIALSFLIFELGYCNADLLNNSIGHLGATVKYNFSFCRIFVYSVLMFLYVFFSNGFIDCAIESAANKYKRVFVYIADFAVIMITLLYIVLCIYKPAFIRPISIGTITVILGSLFLIYVSNNPIRNAIVMFNFCYFVYNYNKF